MSWHLQGVVSGGDEIPSRVRLRYRWPCSDDGTVQELFHSLPSPEVFCVLPMNLGLSTFFGGSPICSKCVTVSWANSEMRVWMGQGGGGRGSNVSCQLNFGPFISCQ